VITQTPLTSTQCRIILVDDHDILRLGLKNLINREAEIEIVGEARNGRAALEILRHVSCDLVIMDLSMPDMDGLQAIETIVTRYPDLKIMILTMHKEREFFREALAYGVHGYILKDDSFDRILDAVREIRAGKKVFSAELAATLEKDYFATRAHPSLESLTRREKEIFRLIASGETNNSIGQMLQISSRTVQTHRSNLMGKLALKNTAGLVRFAISRGLL